MGYQIVDEISEAALEITFTEHYNYKNLKAMTAIQLVEGQISRIYLYTRNSRYIISFSRNLEQLKIVLLMLLKLKKDEKRSAKSQTME